MTYLLGCLLVLPMVPPLEAGTPKYSSCIDWASRVTGPDDRILIATDEHNFYFCAFRKKTAGSASASTTGVPKTSNPGVPE
jgi:hypothetical protein